MGRSDATHCKSFDISAIDRLIFNGVKASNHSI